MVFTLLPVFTKIAMVYFLHAGGDPFMKIGLFGQFGSGNTGNDGSLEAMLRLLDRICPNAQLVCICSRPDVISEKYEIASAPVGQPASENRLMRTLNSVLLHVPRRLSGFVSAVSLAQGLDFIIVPGTGILDDFNENPFGWPFAVLRWSVAAKIAGARLAFISIGAGPVTLPLSRFFVRRASMLASYRSYRDQVSLDFMRSLGVISINDVVTADIAFSLPTVEESVRKVGTQTIGLGIMDYKGWRKNAADASLIYDTYLDKMAKLLDQLLAQGKQVRLLTGDRADFKAVEDLLKRLAMHKSNSIIFEPALSLNQLMQQIAQVDIVVASRYHNIVCALAMGRPAISVAYAKKNDALLHDTGLSQFCHHIENFEPTTLQAQIERMLLQKDQLSIDVKAGVKQYRERLNVQEEMLRRSLFEQDRKKD
ncbi:exopolysaccharide biosynthesis protein [Brucella sp. NBRC 12950]|nr:exopolysaccharide biosynthesis protein [Brucella sp. NBRC 12950]